MVVKYTLSDHSGMITILGEVQNASVYRCRGALSLLLYTDLNSADGCIEAGSV